MKIVVSLLKNLTFMNVNPELAGSYSSLSTFIFNL